MRPIFDGRCKMVLDKDKILFQYEELTCYHKREYDFVTSRIIKFESEDEAEIMFSYMHRLYGAGRVAGKDETMRHVTAAIQKTLGELKDVQ